MGVFERRNFRTVVWPMMGKRERGARDRSEMFFFLSLDEEDENGFTFGHTWILLLFRLRSWHDYDKV